MPLRPLLVALALAATPPTAVPGGTIVREQRGVTIDGVREDWRLVWRGVPRDSRSCGPVDPDMAATCPCSGVAYAQVGDLVLERRRPGAPVERLALSPFFAGSDMVIGEGGRVAMLPRWPAQPRDVDRPPTPAALRARPAPPILRLRDYDHDGIAGEFLLQVDTHPCGKRLLVAVGVTRDRPRLHALTSAEHPGRPLTLYQWQWNALARSPHPGEVVDWPCGDHGAEEETTMLLRADRGRLHATRVTRTCPDDPGARAGGRHRVRPRRVLKREAV